MNNLERLLPNWKENAVRSAQTAIDAIDARYKAAPQNIREQLIEIREALSAYLKDVDTLGTEKHAVINASYYVLDNWPGDWQRNPGEAILKASSDADREHRIRMKIQSV